MSLRIFTIILDGLGIGDLPDAEQFGDSNCNTLAHLTQAVGGLSLPALEGMGLGHAQPFAGMAPNARVRGCFGRMTERSAGKDSTTGHWELAGLLLDTPFPLYPDGFPESILGPLRERSGLDFLGNVAASGTEIIQRLGAEHLATGKPIVYTSADSVFQVAAHESVMSEEELYAFCLLAREIFTGPHAVSRVIARPFRGEAGKFTRTPGRRDFSLAPPGPTLLDRLADAGVPVVGVGKVKDLFAGRGFSQHQPSKSNAEGMAAFDDLLRRGVAPGFFLVNLVDFDMLWGHRNDPDGFAQGLKDFDDWLASFLSRLEAGDRLFITADHGNDPTTPGTDHTREYVPILATRPGMEEAVDLGIRASFADYAATVAEGFGLDGPAVGESFWDQLES